MVRPSDDAGAKVTWAERRLAELDQFLRAFDAANPEPVETDFDTEGRKVYSSKDPPPPPPEVALMVGEILYEFRSALDCAVYAISEGRPGFSPESCEFPLFLYPTAAKSRDPYPQGFDPDGLRKIQLLPKGAKEIVRSYQPYASHSSPAEAPLWLLHELRNIDGHRKILLARTRVTAKFVTWYGDPEPGPLGPLTLGGPGFREGDVVLTIEDSPGTQFHTRFQTEVVLGEAGQFRDIKLLAVLVAIGDNVNRAVSDLQTFS